MIQAGGRRAELAFDFIDFHLAAYGLGFMGVVGLQLIEPVFVEIGKG